MLRAALGAAFSLAALACAADADSPSSTGGGAMGSGATGSGNGATGSGGTTTGSGGTAGTTGTSGSSGTGAAGSTGTGGTVSGGATGAGGTVSSGGTGAYNGGAAGTGTMPPPDVSLALPYTEDWETGSINPNVWLPSDNTLLSHFSVVDDEDGKALQFSGPEDEVQLVGGDLAWTDIKLEVKMKIVSGDPTAAIGVRFNALKTFYYIEIGNEHFKIRDRNNGASDVQPAGDKPPLVTGQWYTVGFIIQGQNVTGQLDGVDIASGPLSGGTPVANGGIALGCKSSFEGVLLFDDVTVSAL